MNPLCDGPLFFNSIRVNAADREIKVFVNSLILSPCTMLHTVGIVSNAPNSI